MHLILKAMKVISFMNFKGGCGKTTLACLLALYLAEKKRKKISMRDLDKSGSTQAFVNVMAHDKITSFSGGEEDDYLFVDTPGGITSDELEGIMELSDLIIIPMSLSPTDVRSTKSTIDSLSKAEKVRILFNKVKTQTSAFKTRNLIAETMGLPGFKTYIKERVCYSYALVDGISAMNKHALEEMGSLTKEIAKYAK